MGNNRRGEVIPVQACGQPPASGVAPLLWRGSLTDRHVTRISTLTPLTRRLVPLLWLGGGRDGN